MTNLVKLNQSYNILIIFSIILTIISCSDTTISNQSASVIKSDTEHKIKFNAIASGNKDADGWVQAKSSSAGFLVMLPGKYNDFHQSVNTVKGNSLTTHHVGMTTPEGVRYTVSGFEGGDKPPIEILPSVANNFVKHAEILEKKELELNGYPGIQLIMRDFRSGGATVRAYAYKDMYYLLIVEYPLNLAISEANNIKKFLESFVPK